MIATIYSLNCPIYDIPKYIGRTIQPVKTRYDAHLQNVKHLKNKVTNWIKGLQSKGLNPKLEIIDIVPSLDVCFWEQHYISLYRSWGFNLKNMTLGGESNWGHKHSLESKKKMSESRRGVKLKPHSEETRRKISLSNRKKSQKLVLREWE